MDVQKIFNDEFKKLEESGKINEIFQGKIAEMFEAVANKLFRHSDDIKNAIFSKIDLNLEKIDFMSYNRMISDLIDSELRNTAYTEAIPKVKFKIAQTLGVLDKKTWKLSEIIEKMIDDISEDEGEITCIVEGSRYSSVRIYIDEEQGVPSHDCRHRLGIEESTGKLWLYGHEGQPANLIKNPFDLTHSFDRFMFSLYANECCIEIDDFETEFCKREDY